MTLLLRNTLHVCHNILGNFNENYGSAQVNSQDNSKLGAMAIFAGLLSPLSMHALVLVFGSTFIAWRIPGITRCPNQGRPGGLGVATPRFWAGGAVGGLGDSRLGRGGSLNIIISYHVQDVCSKVVTFEEK